MAEAHVQSTAGEETVRSAIEQALQAQGGTTVESRPGLLTMDVGGSVKSVYLAGGFRNKMKMPMRDRGHRGGWLAGSREAAEGRAQAWLAMAVDAAPDKVEAPAPPPS
ncbi:MAG: hypothetical protein ACRDHJ_02635 [Actinomycetota bacterium]